MRTTRDNMDSARLKAYRAGLRRLAEDARVIDRLAALGGEGMKSGVDDPFDIDAFVEDATAGSKRGPCRAEGPRRNKRANARRVNKRSVIHQLRCRQERRRKALRFSALRRLCRHQPGYRGDSLFRLGPLGDAGMWVDDRATLIESPWLRNPGSPERDAGYGSAVAASAARRTKISRICAVEAFRTAPALTSAWVHIQERGGSSRMSHFGNSRASLSPQ